MKTSHSLRQDSSMKKGVRAKSIQNKQNEPLNSGRKTRQLKLIESNKRIGQEIKNKIHKAVALGEGDLNAGRPHNIHMRSSLEDKPITASSLIKNVSFDNLEKGSSKMLSRHSSKKSILKNSLSKINPSSSLMKSQISSTNSHANSQDQSIENLVGNKTIKEKYEKLMHETKNTGKRYTDQIFPPIKSSLYLNNSLMKSFCEMFEKDSRAIEWMRLSEIYANRELTIWTNQKEEKCIVLKGYISKTGGDGDFLPNTFNLIREKNNILQKMFESQIVNKQGLYYVKIHQTQTNIWKYVIVDDYIPVIINKKLSLEDRYHPENIYPAFLNIVSYGKTLEIWPFLLQKAYAKYYSTYDSLGNGFTYDFVEEITGVLLETQKIKDNLDKVNRLLKNEDTLLLGEDKTGQLFPLKTFISEGSDKKYMYLDRQNNFIEKTVDLEEFLNKFAAVHYSFLHKYFFTATCFIKQQNLKNKTNLLPNNYILRHIKIEEPTDCQIGIVQKQQRFYRSYLTYEYSWIRMILVEKESRGYRWINAAYSNSKTIKFTSSLSPGEYVVIIMPEWKQKPYNFNLMFMGNAAVNFERKPYETYQNIIQEGCMDLAQRQGKLIQVNKNICSYHYIEKNIGFVIENINNEKEHGSVRVLRSIEGLQNYNITPLNPEFKTKNTVEITIPSNNHFTVVLMTRKGVEPAFLQMFDFGF